MTFIALSYCYIEMSHREYLPLWTQVDAPDSETARLRAGEWFKAHFPGDMEISVLPVDECLKRSQGKPSLVGACQKN